MLENNLYMKLIYKLNSSTCLLQFTVTSCNLKAPILFVRYYSKLDKILCMSHGLIIVMNDYHLSCSLTGQ